MDSPNDVAGTNILPGIVENIKNDYDNVVTNRGAKIKGEDIKFPDNLG